MNSHYRFELVKKQLEGERAEVIEIENRLRVAFADVYLLHDALARGRIHEEDLGNLPRALHLFRACARDLLACYEAYTTPCLRDLGWDLPHDLGEQKKNQH